VFSAQTPISPVVYVRGKFRCNICLTIFKAELPDDINEEERYDVTCAPMIALLRYGSGFPFYRLEKLQGLLGAPFADSTQWDIVNKAYYLILFIFVEGESGRA
jgi:transposase